MSSLWFARQADGFRGWVSPSNAAGHLKTGMLAGDFVVTVVDPDDSASTVVTVSESTQKPGTYFFTIPSSFITTNGVGEYHVTVQVDTKVGPSGPPHIEAIISNVLVVSQQDFDSLVNAILNEPLSTHTVAGSHGLAQMLTHYGGSVVIDTVNGAAGTTYPLGTFSNPVSNLANALTIATAFGIRRFIVRGSITLTSTLVDRVWEGLGESTVINLNGQSVTDSEFANVRLLGTLGGGPIRVRDSKLDNIGTFHGTAVGCSLLSGTITLGGNARFVDCSSAVAGSSVPIVNMNGGVGRTLEFRAYAGGVQVNGVDDGADRVSLDLIGQVILDATCTAGVIEVRGVGRITNNAGVGCTVNIAGFQNPGASASAVLDEILASHTVPGSVAEVLELIKAILGLVA